MNIIHRVRRGVTSVVTALIGPSGSLIFDTQRKKLFIHDGETAGGINVTGVNEAEVEQLVTNGVSNKVDKVEGKGLSTNDYTTTEKSKLTSVGSMAYRNVFISTSTPTAGDGQDGDLWLQYS